MRAPVAVALLGLLLSITGRVARADDAEPSAGADTPPAAAKAEDAGQDDLDRAMEEKLGARDVRELKLAINLAESALDKGLTGKNEQFAKSLLSSSLMERGMSMTESIFMRSPPPQEWPQMRQSALADLEKALQYDPSLAEASFQIARLQLLPGGDRKRAYSAVDDVVRLSGADEPVRKAEALTLRAGMQSSLKKSLDDLNEAIALVPKDPKPLRIRGTLKMTLKDYDGAVGDFTDALEIEPEDAATHEAKGLALASQEKWADARASLDRAAKLAPTSTNVLLQRGRINVIAGDVAAGVADFTAALQIEPDNLPALLMRAEVQTAEHPQLAMNDLNHALEVRPGLVPALRQRAIISATSRKYASAISDLELVRKLEPEDQTVGLQLAAVYTVHGKQAEALKVYDQLIDADTTNWMAYRGRADAYLNQGKQREAIEDYEQALKNQPGDSGVLNNLAWVLATSPEAGLRDGKRAIELAKRACEETKFKQPHILSTLAASYAETGDFASAVEWSKKALELSTEALRPALAKELESYESSQPWRESQTADASDANKPKESTRR